MTSFRLWLCLSLAMILPIDVYAQKPELVLELGHYEPLRQVVFRPTEGNYVASLSEEENTIRIWQFGTGHLLRNLTGPADSGQLSMMAFSPDGKLLATGSRNKTILLFNVATGKLQRTIQRGSEPVAAVSLVFSRDGATLATLTSSQTGGSTVTFWAIPSGKELRSFRDPTGHAGAAALSPDGKTLAAPVADNSIRLWNFETGQPIRTLQGQKGLVGSLLFLDDNTLASASGNDPAIRIWNATSGQEIRSLNGHQGGVSQLALQPNSKILVSASRDQTLRSWDASTGKELRSLRAENEWFTALAFRSDGKTLVTGSQQATVRLWDFTAGKTLKVLEQQVRTITGLALGPGRRTLACGCVWDPARVFLWDLDTGKLQGALAAPNGADTGILTASADGNTLAASGYSAASVVVWNLRTASLLHLLKLPPPASAVGAIALSPDGKTLATARRDGVIHLWSVATGKVVTSLKGHQKFVFGLAFSPDGKTLASACADQTVRLWDPVAGKQIGSWATGNVGALAFAPDGKAVAVVATGNPLAVQLWDLRSGKVVQSFNKGTYTRSLAFSPDGKTLATGGQDNVVKVWEVATGKEQVAFLGHAGHITSVVFGPGGRALFSASFDGTVKVWPLVPGKGARTALATLAHFSDDTWAVLGRDGLFDAAKGGDVPGLHWVVGQEPIELKQLKDRYYDPGLLAKYLGSSKEPVREVAAFKSVKLYPRIAITQADPKKPRMDVTLTNRGGGIGRTVVLVNGKELSSDARPRGVNVDAGKLDLQLDLSSDPRVVPGQKNTIEVLAYNAEGYLCSRGLVREFDGPGAVVKARKPTLYAIVVGVSKYRNEKLDLRYAAKDAEDFATALRLAATRLFGAQKVQMTLLTTINAQTRPTRAAIEKALASLKTAKPDDIVVVYLAGHGVAQGGQDGDWYYLTADAANAEMADPEVRKQATLSSVELTDLLKASPARKQVLILDTCHSGRVVEKLTEKRDVPGSQVRALERLKDRTGMHVLAGCAADSVSYEASRYGQGILTYSLLLGMRGAKLREGEYVDIVDLFNFAADKVPELARDIGGVQRPTIASPRGTSFDIGRITAADRSKVPLQMVKPVVLRTSFQDEKRVKDVLGLSKLVDERLREASSTPRGAKLVFVDAGEFPGGVQPVGRYKQDGEKVIVSVTLYDGDREVASFFVEGAANKADELAEKITKDVEKKLIAISVK